MKGSLALFGIALLGMGTALAVGPAQADDVDGIDGRDRAVESARRWDYSRFSDGPRRVPTPRGASLQRARALGLGTFRTANRLLSGPPAAQWVNAAPGPQARTLHWPVDGGRYGRGFGFTRRVRQRLRHDGIDIVAPEGTVVRAVADGIVAYSDNGIRGFGNCVLIVHPNGWVSLYAHNQRNTVQPGWRVRRGERIGFVGATGIARGPHLHFELRQGGRPIDPARLFDRGTVADPEPGGVEVALGGEDTDAAAASAASTAAAPAADEPAETEPAEVATADGATTGIGTVELVRSLMRGRIDPALRERAGRLFSNLLWPARGGRIERGFEARGHRGIDVEAEVGTAVRAAADGLVVYVGDGLTGMGTAVVLLHRNGWVTLYGSNDEVAVEVGQTVRRGEWIAEVGETGASEGAHLHFELHDAGALRDPAPLLVHAPGS